MVIDWQAFSKQWLDHNYDHAPHCADKAQDLSFEMACFQGCTDHVVPATHINRHAQHPLTPPPPTHTHQKSAMLYLYVCVWPWLRICVLCLCVCVCVCVCVCCACLFVCVAEARHDPYSLGNQPFQTRCLVPYLYYVEDGHCDLTILYKNACQSKTT